MRVLLTSLYILYFDIYWTIRLAYYFYFLLSVVFLSCFSYDLRLLSFSYLFNWFYFPFVFDCFHFSWISDVLNDKVIILFIGSGASCNLLIFLMIWCLYIFLMICSIIILFLGWESWHAVSMRFSWLLRFGLLSSHIIAYILLINLIKYTWYYMGCYLILLLKS